MTQPGEPQRRAAAAAALIASTRLGGELLGDLGPLLAGDVILLGSLVQTQWVQAGDAVTVTNDPLGEVAADFT